MICDLCFHHCNLSEGQTGFCRARMNRGGRNVSLTYGRLTALALDPVEKKPLKRFHPGSKILSVGSFGCNLHCPFCQNYEISMADARENAHDRLKASPDDLVREAQYLTRRGNIGLAYTYNEPMVSYEFVRDCAEKIHAAGLINVLVSNGTLEEPYFRDLICLMDAANIDLKGFTEEWYHFLGGDLGTVKRNIRIAAQTESCHLEITTLIIPGENDSERDMRRECEFLSSIDHTIPLHITRFFPRYHMTDLAPTPLRTIYHLTDIAKEYLDYVYPGNV